MNKKDELADPNSCLNKNTTDDTVLFVLKDSDLAMGDTIRYWAEKRVELGLNRPTDKKILDALKVAEEVDQIQENRE